MFLYIYRLVGEIRIRIRKIIYYIVVYIDIPDDIPSSAGDATDDTIHVETRQMPASRAAQN